MIKPSQALVIAVAAIALAGCAREPKVVSSTPDVITIRSWGDASGAVRSTEKAAVDECARYGRRAKFRTVNGLSTGEQDVIYDCIV